MTELVIVKGDDRIENLDRALGLMNNVIDKSIAKKGSGSLFIKVNAIDTHFPLAVTRPEALEAVVRFFYDKFERIIIGDNSFVFKKYMDSNIYSHFPGMFKKVELSDLTNFGSKDIEFKQLNGNIIKGTISTLTQEMYSISLSLPKTHDTFVYTGCSKNGMGCVMTKRPYVHALELNERMMIKKVVRSNVVNRVNLVNVIEASYPDLSILDGFLGMEGNGPMFGSEIPLGIAMCSCDSIALDTVMSNLTGLGYVPYLHPCQEKGLGTMDIEKMEIIKDGFDDFKEIYKPFKPHPNANYQTMVEFNSIFPKIDFHLLFGIAKRFHRVKDKVFEEMANTA
ncbi:MAG: DUF362 domain-containing protein [Candidatus Anammoxibacter sp.]